MRLIPLLFVLLLVVGNAQQPGDSGSLTCPTSFVATFDPQTISWECSPLATIEPTNTLVPTPVPSNTQQPTATTIPSSTRTATPMPISGVVVGPGVGEYRTIALGMNAAPAASTLRIRAGVYLEEVVVSKNLTILPYGDGDVWIDGNCSRAHNFRFSSSGANGSVVKGLLMRRALESSILIENLSVQRITIDGNTIIDFDCDNSGPENQAGVAVWYGGQQQTIINNTIKRRSVGSLDGGQSNCIWFKSNSANRSGGGHVISGNSLIGCWDGVGGEVEDDVRGVFDGNTTIEGNTVTDCWDDGIQVEGRTAGVKVLNNLIERCPIGIANAPNLIGPLLIEGNMIRNGRPGWAGNVACFKIGDGGTGVANYVGNNCVLTQGSTDGWAQTNSGNNPIVARNNVIRVTNYVMEFTGGVAAGTSFDEDCLWSTGSNFAKWNGTQISFAGLRNRGHELNGESHSGCG